MGSKVAPIDAGAPANMRQIAEDELPPIFPYLQIGGSEIVACQIVYRCVCLPVTTPGFQSMDLIFKSYLAAAELIIHTVSPSSLRLLRRVVSGIKMIDRSFFTVQLEQLQTRLLCLFPSQSGAKWSDVYFTVFPPCACLLPK